MERNKVLEELLEEGNCTPGEGTLLRAYLKAKKNYYKTNELVLTQCWAKEIPDLVALMAQAEIFHIIIIDASTALMENLHIFQKNGYKIERIVEVQEIEKDCLGLDPLPIKGLRLINSLI